jgi:3-hydroxy-9,10-secoandrosta-1,3,5(10)-triene-9,17-dione monooxygenase reductase component
MITKEEFKIALGHWASGVTIITYKDGNIFSGLTASSFTSLSMDPFLILFCLNSNSVALEKINSAKSFAVNILSKEQESLSNSFANPTSDRNSILIENGFTIKTTGSPLINNSLVHLDCTLDSIFDGGDHKIITGKVEFASTDITKNPLLYYNKKYHSI